MKLRCKYELNGRQIESLQRLLDDEAIRHAEELKKIAFLYGLNYPMLLKENSQATVKLVEDILIELGKNETDGRSEGRGKDDTTGGY